MDREVVLQSAAVVLLLVVILFMCWLHACGRWKQRRPDELAGQSMDIFIAEVDNEERATASWKGLDKAALEALPTFVYSSSEDYMNDSEQGNVALMAEEQAERGSSSSSRQLVVVECPVCLSEFQEEEIGRLLPNCRHRFHVECIDTWLLANGTCPVCRASCAADVAGQQASMGAAGVQYPTNVLFWGSNSVLVSSGGATLHQYSAPIQIVTQPAAPPPPPHLMTSAPSSSSSTLNSLRRLLSRERIHTAPLYSKV